MLVSDEGTLGELSPGGPGAWVDVFHEPPEGWTGDVTESARLEDPDGIDTYLDGAVGDGAIADADSSHGAVALRSSLAPPTVGPGS